MKIIERFSDLCKKIKEFFSSNMVTPTKMVQDEQLGTLMTGLIYPAFLGSAFVWFFGKIASQISKGDNFIDFIGIENCYAVWLIIYFCFSFVIMVKFPISKMYNCVMFFLIDSIDVITIFVLFYLLGFVDDDSPKPNLKLFYFVSLQIPIFAFISNKYLGRKLNLTLISFATIILIAMGFVGYNFCIANYSAFVALGILLIVYARNFKNR